MKKILGLILCVLLVGSVAYSETIVDGVQKLDNAVLTGGTINDAVIGGTTPAAIAGTTITGTTLTTTGKLVMTPSATTASPTTYADDTAIVVSFSYVRVEGNGGAVTLDTDPAVADGTADGQIVYIQGCDDTNTVTIADAVNTQLSGGTSFTMGSGDILTLLWDAGGSLWIEASRSDN